MTTSAGVTPSTVVVPSCVAVVVPVTVTVSDSSTRSSSTGVSVIARDAEKLPAAILSVKLAGVAVKSAASAVPAPTVTVTDDAEVSAAPSSRAVTRSDTAPPSSGTSLGSPSARCSPTSLSASMMVTA